MCGIAGFVGKMDNPKKVLKQMTDIIAYRGPDAEGSYFDKDVALGHRRLAIIDIKSGKQPMISNSKKNIIVFNGEIYNFKELKKELPNYDFKTNSDTEVLLAAYEKWGHDMVNHLRGMFAFAIWDSKREELFMARDKWGIKPLYYTYMNNVFMFSSEIKAFLGNPAFKKELNTDILASYLCYNSTPTRETFFKNVYRLDPGTILIYKSGKIEKKEYFHLDFEPKEETLEEAKEEIAKAMKDSVEHHQIADVEVGSFLSSGIDSSYLVSIAKPDKTYTVGYDNPKYDEISYAKDLSKKLHINNTSKKITKKEYINNFEKIMYYMDEPLADPSAIALYFVAEIASKDVKVVMSGEGADELFAGYLTYLEDYSQEWYMKIPYSLRHIASNIAGLFPDVRGFNFIYRRGQKLEDYNIGLGRVFRTKEAMKIVKCPNQIKPESLTQEIYKENKGKSNTIKRQAIDFYLWLVHDFLHAVDRNTMMFGLEARTPFLDDKVYEVARHLPDNLKLDHEGHTKIALRAAAKETIPNDAYKKKKLGFPVPLREWIKDDDLHNNIKEKFSSSDAEKFFNQKEILKLLDETINGRKDTYKKVWVIYTFLVWYDIYFNDKYKEYMKV